MVDKSLLDDPRKLSSFAVLCFADLKKYHYLHWFCFPAFKSTWKVTTGQRYFKQEEDRLLNTKVAIWKSTQHQSRHGVFAVIMSSAGIEVFPFDFLTTSTWQDTPYDNVSNTAEHVFAEMNSGTSRSSIPQMSQMLSAGPPAICCILWLLS